jgi:ABC-type phosphate/phosphonate transport system permease subunit
MGWADRELKKHRMRKQIDQVLNEPEYREERRKWEEQAVLQALLKFVFIGLVWLEMNFRCKRNGLIKFLEFVKGTMADIEGDDEFFNAANKYYVEKYNLDVMEYLGMALVKKGENHETH